ncbi:DUF5710 domain-containing protein [Nocardiopsis sinuspersici]|uniref:DUF5710 domain-containing protein n=1 Tax=Nocardiopsis sinuspersici TaxID=501010 RepID=UPI00307F475D
MRSGPAHRGTGPPGPTPATRPSDPERASGPRRRPRHRRGGGRPPVPPGSLRREGRGQARGQARWDGKARLWWVRPDTPREKLARWL